MGQNSDGQDFLNATAIRCDEHTRVGNVWNELQGHGQFMTTNFLFFVATGKS
jgi:hypothetical protein